MNKLCAKVVNLDYYNSSPTPKNWNIIRKKAVKYRNNICMYCGYSYEKYMYCIHLDHDKNNNSLDNLQLCCKLCNIVTHVNTSECVLVCMSDLTQVDIVKLTSDYISSNGHVPDPVDIDSTVKKLDLSIVEYSVLLQHNVSWLSQFKIFFNDNLDISSLGFNPFESKTFGKKVSSKNIPTHIFTTEQINDMKKIFYSKTDNISYVTEQMDSVNYEIEQVTNNYNRFILYSKSFSNMPTLPT